MLPRFLLIVLNCGQKKEAIALEEMEEEALEEFLEEEEDGELPVVIEE